MAIDFLILCLLILSLAINLLALGAFWVTPGLRTTANRFVINLLIVNIIGCLALTPTLFLRSNSYSYETLDQTKIEKINIQQQQNDNYNKQIELLERDSSSGSSSSDSNSNSYDEYNKNKLNTEEMMVKCVGNYCEKIIVDSRDHHHKRIKMNRRHGQNVIEYSNDNIDDAKQHKNNNNKNYDNDYGIDEINENDDGMNRDDTMDEDETIVITEMDIKTDQADSKQNHNKKIYAKNIPTVSQIGLNGESNRIDGDGSGNVNIKKNYGKITEEHYDNFLKKKKMFGVNNNQKDTLTLENNVKDDVEDDFDPTKNLLRIQSDIRCWSLDLVAALSALSVLLIVGDTWCAVTDPLRYHSRISGLKAWLLIAFIWFLSISFGVLSALRETTLTSETVLKENLQNNNTGSNLITVFRNGDIKTYRNSSIGDSSYTMITYEHENLYNMIYSCIYFIMIILLPFGLVCGMYWRIFSEARENGLRMRQNGSSPLLQSALNLAGHNQHHPSKYHMKSHSQNHICVNPMHQINASTMNLTKDNNSNQGSTIGGLQLRIDHNDKDNTNKSLLLNPEKDKNQNNILLTLSEANNDEIKRNYSTRHLAVLGSSQDFIDGAQRKGIRQVHSTPNLQKYQKRTSDGSITEIDLNTYNAQNSGHHHHHHHALQLPSAIHQNTSPKALSYMTSIRHRLSNASSLFKYREESRAARISILVVIMFLVSYLPYGILVLLQGRIFYLSNHATQLAIFVVLLGNLSSPVIFAYRNKRVRRGVKRLFNLDPRAKDRQLQRRGVISPSHNNQNNNNSSGHNNHTSGLTNFIRSNVTNSTKIGDPKSSINIKNSSNKVSTYSLNTCKFLTPAGAATAAQVAASSFLIDLEKCHYLKNNGYPSNSTIIKISKLKRNSSKPIVQEEEYDDDDFDNDLSEHISDSNNEPIEIISDSSVANNSQAEKRSILKIVCDSSRKLGCASGHSCASSDCEIEPTDV